MPLPRFRLLAVAMLALATPLPAPAATMQAVPGGVDLRAAPSDTAYVVSQAMGGETLELQGDLASEWVAVTPPSRVSFWMYSDLVRNGVVIAPKVEVRAGPGIDYESVGSVVKGTPLSIRGSQGAWLEIVPPERCRLWVRRSQLVSGDGGRAREVAEVTPPVTRTAPPVPSAVAPVVVPVRPPTPPAPVPSTQRVARAVPGPVGSGNSVPRPSPPADPPARLSPAPPVPPVRSVPTPAPPVATPVAPIPSAGDPLPPGAELVRPVRVEGVVRPRGILSRQTSTPCRLVRRDMYGRTVTVCVLLQGPQVDLTRVLGLPVRISGREYQVRGWRHPLVVAERVETLASEPSPVSGPVRQ